MRRGALNRTGPEESSPEQDQASTSLFLARASFYDCNKNWLPLAFGKGCFTQKPGCLICLPCCLLASPVLLACPACWSCLLAMLYCSLVVRTLCISHCTSGPTAIAHLDQQRFTFKDLNLVSILGVRCLKPHCWTEGLLF